VEPAEQTSEEMILALLTDGGDQFTSGEALSGKLGLSRAAVWKHVESLRRKGYRIEAISSKGYRLLGVPDRVTPLELSAHLQTEEIGRTLHYRESLESTNELAYQLAMEGAAHGEVVIADQQTRGKGRRGRSWSSPPGKNLYCSIILRPELAPQRAPELTLVTAVAVAASLREFGAQVKIKWPNDLLLNQLKVGGILTELSAEQDRIHFAVVGVGVNLNAEPADFPEEVRTLATSVRQALGRPVLRAPFAATMWARMEEWFRRHAESGFRPVRDAWKQISATLGRKVLIKGERLEVQGVAEDIDEGGALLVRTERGTLERVLAGDLEQVAVRE
jgi:BirA family transcriptional regulator, biotin operon repressor / biotin---[acetyl-CoA-carboxylase] ligase